MLKRLLPAVLVLGLLLPGVPSIARTSSKIELTQAQGFYIFGTNNNLHTNPSGSSHIGGTRCLIQRTPGGSQVAATHMSALGPF